MAEYGQKPRFPLQLLTTGYGGCGVSASIACAGSKTGELNTEIIKGTDKIGIEKDGIIAIISKHRRETLVRSKIASDNFKQRALDKIGLDESQVNEIPPVFFEGYFFDEKKGLPPKLGKDRVWRSSIYQLSWLFFSDTQVYVYQYEFNLAEDSKRESTEEFFYKDITNFSSSSETIERQETVEKAGCRGMKNGLVRKNIEAECFALVVPGEKF